MPDLSIIIPARDEQFLLETVEDIRRNKRGDTETIVILDGAWPDRPLPQYPDVKVVYLPKSIGQRAATNLGAQMSEATYIMKLDAHCSLAEGFDVELIATAKVVGEDVTQIPTQYNLHAFDWVCTGCGTRIDQGPTPTGCKTCAKAGQPQEWQKKVVWGRRRITESWRFDSELKFQYFGEYKDRAFTGEIEDVMSCLGACWFMARTRYWFLEGMDEAHGSWGQMGTELACKSWLSGGRMVVNRRTWFAHMFRTQGKDFGFPYAMDPAAQEYARTYSKKLWRGNRWPKQVRPLRWLVEKFWPVPGWTQEALDALPAALGTTQKPTVGLVYYSDCRGPVEVLEAVRRQIKTCCNGHQLVSVTLEPVSFGQNIVLPLERGPLAMFQQILAGLEALTTDIAFLVEHDVIYHPSHFDFVPPRDDTVYYNQHVYKVCARTGKALHYRCSQTSGLCARRDLLIAHYRKRVAMVKAFGFSRRMGFEPGTRQIRHGGVDDLQAETWMSESPNIDIRHGENLTPSRWKKEQFRNQRYTEGWTESDSVPGWGVTKGRFHEFLQEATCGG